MKSKSKSAKRREAASKLERQRTVSVAMHDVCEDDFNTLLIACHLYNEAYSYVVRYCRENQTTSKTKLQKELYHILRDLYPELPSQFICIALRDGAGAVKSWNSNNPDERWLVRSRREALTMNYDKRIFSLRGNLITLSGLVGHKRIRAMIDDIPKWFTEKYPDCKWNAAKITLHPETKTIIVHLIYRLEPMEHQTSTKVLGVDLGCHDLYHTSNNTAHKANHAHSGKRRYAHNRKTLQEKGTRSARRRLKTMRKREKRFIKDVNHCAANDLISEAKESGCGYIAMEDLTNIRSIVKKTKGKKNKTKSEKRYHSMLHAWSFAQFQDIVAYKAADVGISCIFVNPYNTSRKCNICGYTSEDNRNHARFDCQSCGNSDNADFNAAKNIRDAAQHEIPVARTLQSTVGQGGCHSPACTR